MNMDTELRLISAQEASKILRVSRNTIYDLWDAGRLDYWNVSGTRRTNLIAIREFLEREKRK